MRRTISSLLAALFALGVALPAASLAEPTAPQAMQAVPTRIPFQGFLTNDTGVPIDATVSLGLTLYDAASGGNVVWGPEAHSVAVSAGVFQVNLGETVALDPALFTTATALYLGITVDGGAELTPRTQLLSVPFALGAENAQNALNGGGSALWSTDGTSVWRLTGRVGIGRTPGSTFPLDVIGDTRIQSGSLEIDNPNNPSARCFYNWLGDVARIRIGGSGAGANNGFVFHGTGNATLLRITNDARIGVGTATPVTACDVIGNGYFSGRLGVGTTTPATTLDVNGAITIRGGADIVEGFGTQSGPDVEPGTVMVIDADHEGLLAVSGQPYDARVAGVVSGAGGVNPGLKLGHDSRMDGDLPVAMSGRVYVKCTAENGPIRPGDRLTTSSLAGHAMKATDAGRTDGAVLGKAMSSLDEGTGLVLVLVNLQ